ncbi:hypothetical protein PV392_23670 [Streptomyces sp. ME03-5709C]|nr:hypothetical protein [Streptomyces sp. ME03-5709C]
MTAPALVVAAGQGRSATTTRGPERFTDAHHLGPGPKRPLAVAEGGHLFGGISGEAAEDTTDEDPARVVLVADVVSARPHDVLSTDTRGRQAPRDRIGHSPGAFTTESQWVPRGRLASHPSGPRGPRGSAPSRARRGVARLRRFRNGTDAAPRGPRTSQSL